MIFNIFLWASWFLNIGHKTLKFSVHPHLPLGSSFNLSSFQTSVRFKRKKKLKKNSERIKRRRFSPLKQQKQRKGWLKLSAEQLGSKRQRQRSKVRKTNHTRKVLTLSTGGADERRYRPLQS